VQIVASLKHIAIAIVALFGTILGPVDARADSIAACAIGPIAVDAGRGDVVGHAATAEARPRQARVVTVATKRCDRMPSHSCDETCEQLLRPSATQQQVRQKFAIGHRAERIGGLSLAHRNAMARGPPSGRAEFLIGDGASSFKRMFAKTSRLLS